MQRHSWTYLDNEICCRRFIQLFVLEHRALTQREFMRLLKVDLPDIKETSLLRKISNIKYLSIEAGLSDTLRCSPSANYSKDNRKAFYALLDEYSL